MHPEDRLLLSHIGKDPLIMLRDAELIQDFYKKQNCYEKVPLPEHVRPLFGYGGLTFSEGETWKRHRKILSGSFNYEGLRSKVPLVQATAKEFLGKIGPDGCQEYGIFNKIQEITGEIAGRMFFGEDLKNYSIDNKPLTTYLTDLISDLFVLSLSPMGLLLGEKLVQLTPAHVKVMKRLKKLREMCHKIIADRKAQKGDKGSDLLAILLATQTTGDPDGMMSDEEIVDEFITTFSGGMDSTGHLIGMALYMLTQNPECLAKLKSERETCYKNDVDMEDINKMEEMHCFLKETLRFYNPIPFSMDRIAVKDHTLGDVEIPKGMRVKPDYFAVAFDEKHWVEPEKFNPDRWKGKIDPYTFVPFLAGPRNCIGQHLAIIEAKVIISEFLERFEFKLKDGYQLKMVYRFLNEPEDEIVFDLKHKKEMRVDTMKCF